MSDCSSDVCSSDLLVGVGRELVENALDTSEDVDPLSQIEAAEVALYRVSEGEGEGGSVKSFLQASTMAVQVAERAFSRGGHLVGITQIGSASGRERGERYV